MELDELTMRLSGLCGPSGAEEPVREYIASYLHPTAEEIRTDALGNMIAIKRCGQKNARMLMLDAHMDEIGLITTGAVDGFLLFRPLGGVDPRMLPAGEVRVLSDPPLYGVIDTLPPHILSQEQMDKAVKIEKLAIDVGLTQEQALKAAPPGTPVVYAATCEKLGSHQLCGKALDDRACAAIVIKAFEQLAGSSLSVDLCCLVSTQEEVGHRGAQVAAFQLQPEEAIVVDVTHGKSLDAKSVFTECGKGAAIGIGPNCNRAMGQELMRLAEEEHIPWQAEAEPGGNSGTNAHTIQVAGTGVVTALISLPLKYMHTPVEVIDLSDMQAIVDLIIKYAGSRGI